MLTDAFKSERPCCLDPFWAKPVQQRVLSGQVKLEDVAHAYWKTFRSTSLREEQGHRIQRVFAGGNDAKALASKHQCALSAIHQIKKHFQARGGRDLSHAPVKVQSKFIKHTRKKKTSFSRPNQKGNTMIFFINRQRGSGESKQDLIQKWNALSPQCKLMWKSQHETAVKIKRSQVALQQRSQNTDTQAPLTSWGLGDDEFPLKIEKVQAFLEKFQGKRAGLETLSQSKCPEAQAYCEAVSSGRSQYHFRDAAKIACSAYLGDTVTKNDVTGCALTAEIMSSPVPHIGCHALHPGMCQSRDANAISSVKNIFKILPKKSCILQFKTRRMVLYVRSVLGWGTFHFKMSV